MLTNIFGDDRCGIVDDHVDDDIVIRVENVTKRFGQTTVLDGMNLAIKRGEVLVILGGSGSGKSTLLRTMTGAVQADEGRVLVNLPGRIEQPQNVCGMNDDQLDTYRRAIGVLFQSGALFNSMTVAENVALPMQLHADLAQDIIDISVTMKLEQVNIRHAADRLPSELSGGMKKRAGLARALALDPQILFYDEPSAGLDPITSAEVDQLICDLNKLLGVTSIVVTHEMDSAFRIADRMVLLNKGKFVADGTRDWFRETDDERIRQFVDGNADGPWTSGTEKADGYETALLGKK
ncbi:MAG: ABC transporter ATP-binding protein [Planctomycetota bacterium]